MTAQQGSVPRWQRRLLPADLLGSSRVRRSARDWFVDLALFLAAVGLGVALLAATWSDHDAWTAGLDVLLGTVACLALWLRRQRPVAVAVVAVCVATVSALAGVASLIALFNAVVRASTRALLVIIALWLATNALFPLLFPSLGGYWSQVVLGLVAMVVVIGWGLFARARGELVASLHERAERLESEQRLRVEQARAAERRRIAREMHDVLAHRLSLLSVHAGALEFHPDVSPELVAEAAAVIRASAHSALEELRVVIGVLREDADEAVPEPPQPTAGQIPTLIDESRAAGMNIRWRDDGSATKVIPSALGRTAYRVVQEGLTNARKHAPGAAVDVTLDPGPPLVLKVVSRGAVGAANGGPLPGAGTGLVGLAERVELAGGRLQHGPDANGDFVLRATLPWTP